MMFRDANVATDDEVDQLMNDSVLGRLVTVGADGFANVGLYPFVRDNDGSIELHLNRADEQIEDLGGPGPRCVFEVDDALTATPSHWLDPDFAKLATAFHRTAIFECTASLRRDPDHVAAVLGRIMARYQPEGRYRKIDAADPLYAEAVGELVGIRLTPQRCRTKFKLHQDRQESIRLALADQLRARGRHNDARAADFLAATERTSDQA